MPGGPVPWLLAVRAEEEMRTPPTPFILSLGSNLGDRRAHLQQGLRFLAQRVTIEAVSRLVESAACGPVTVQPEFLNLVVRGSSSTDAPGLLRVARGAEAAAGRTRVVPGGPRTLDVDLIFFGDLRMESASLRLPHPRWAERPFVHRLLPEVAGDLVDPETGILLRELPGVDPLDDEVKLVSPLRSGKPSQGSDYQ